MTQILNDIKNVNKILGESTTGTLNDDNIINICKNNKLLIEENFEIKMVKQCCYELRASEIYIILSNYKDLRACNLDNNKEDYILIKPHNQVVIMTKEKLNIPGNIIGRIMTKGKLFSVGLIPVNTYADSGFKGHLGIVFSNLSNNYIKIRPNDPIAKIEFSKIIGSVNEIYSGQHGYQTGIWPIPEDIILTKKEIEKDSRVFESQLDELESVYGEMIGAQYKKIYKYQRGVMFAFSLYVIINLVLFLFLDKNHLTYINNIFIGVITNIIWMVIWKFVEEKK
ncbi:dCTP deaminase domain-containing protein [Peptoniphilus harei]|uniref:dCTP deaminase domain-containing protein n=1 Tax=Peptoniphilus harei TaxID=54005 RepID=UPI0011DE3FE4|nr:hypothetical protein [Peptoniphilus harei]